MPLQLSSYFIGVVKKMFRYSKLFFYNLLCRTYIFRNINMKIGITARNEGRGVFFVAE